MFTCSADCAQRFTMQRAQASPLKCLTHLNFKISNSTAMLIHTYVYCRHPIKISSHLIQIGSQLFLKSPLWVFYSNVVVLVTNEYDVSPTSFLQLVMTTCTQDGSVRFHDTQGHTWIHSSVATYLQTSPTKSCTTTAMNLWFIRVIQASPCIAKLPLHWLAYNLCAKALHQYVWVPVWLNSTCLRALYVNTFEMLMITG